MFSEFDLSKLPSLPLSQRDSLPICTAIYFATDSKNRVLYVGKAINLLNRWKNHHRQEQLNRINRKNKIKIAWLHCSNNLALLANTETYFIEFYQPLLNRTSVPAKTITPAETVLQQTLRKLAGLNVVVFGIEQAMVPTTIYLKYPVEIYKKLLINDYGINGLFEEINQADLVPTVREVTQSIRNAGLVNSIIQASNKRKSTGLKWREYEREKFYQSKVRSWKTGCNGVNIELSPWKFRQSIYINIQPKLGENAVIQTLAGVEIPALNELGLTNILNKYPFIRASYPRVSILEHDPITLLWSKY